MTFYKFSVGTVLTAAMVTVLGLSAAVFTARDFQFGVAQLSRSTNGRIDFGEFERVEREIAALREASAPTRQQQAEVTERISAFERAEIEAAEARAELVGDLAAVEQRASVDGGADLSTQGLSQRINALAGRTGLSAADQQRVASLAADVTALAQQEAAIAESANARAALSAQSEQVGAQVSQSDSQIHALQAQVVPDYEHYDRIRNEARSLQWLSVFGATTYLAQGHPSLLSTILVVLMGALGSLLYLFPAYLNRDQPVTMGEVFARLIFGMLAALAVYVLANALGSLSAGGVVQEQLTTTSAVLNPFTTSLIGILAGVLSDDIAKWIQERGRGIFTSGGGGRSGGGSASVPEPIEDAAPTGGLVNNDAIR